MRGDAAKLDDALDDLDRDARLDLAISLTRSDFLELEAQAAEMAIDPTSLATVWVVHRLNAEASARVIRADGLMKTAAAPRSGASGSLHDEIVAVMAERGAPMTVGEIASAVRERGRYQSPRSGRPVSSELISRRIANPHYRTLFRRNGRLLELAAADGAEGSEE